MFKNKFTISGVIAVVFFLIKFMEMRFLDRENKPLKELVKETILVFFSATGGFFVMEQLSAVIPNEAKLVSPPIFTGGPEF